MRLWHKDLLPVLPTKHLIAQYRECCAIARNIAVNGTPNHILVNKVMDYPPSHFWNYTRLVTEEMKERGFKVNIEHFSKWYFQFCEPSPDIVETEDIFKDWHDNRYLGQCYCNLQEKYDCGGISEMEWSKIYRCCVAIDSLMECCYEKT